MISLNAAQERAVNHGAGPLVVFAGAGSGKTRVITHRIARLVKDQEAAPWQILAVTFTNKAAAEMRARLATMLGPLAHSLEVGTFHSTCARLLRNHGSHVGIDRDFTIYDDQDQQAAIKRVMRALSVDDKRYPPRLLASRINHAKQEMLGPDRIRDADDVDEVIAGVYSEYESRLRQSNALDFADLIYLVARGLEENAEFRRQIVERFNCVLVDEFQDTNHAQFRFLKALCEEHQNLCVVGDDDQSIYRWRGADRRNILDFRKSFPNAQLIKLEQNYRSTQRILRTAHAVISKNIDREPKELWTENQEGVPIAVIAALDERDEANWALKVIGAAMNQGRSQDDVAIFYRTHAQSRVLEEALRSRNIPYRIVGGMRFYDRSEIKDALAYLRMLVNPQDDVSLLRIINTPSRKIGQTTIERVLEYCSQHRVSVWDALSFVDHMDLSPRARQALSGFRSLIAQMQRSAEEHSGMSVIAQEMLEKSGYVAMLQAEDTPEAEARLQTLQEFVSSVEEYEKENEGQANFAGFLERVTLQTSVEDKVEGARITMMTVHAAKGLEFPVVMMTGLEERLFPLCTGEAWADPEEMEEERRLAYVAFTRAKEELILSYALSRRIFNQTRVGIPSRFLQELPQEDLQMLGINIPRPRPSTRVDHVEYDADHTEHEHDDGHDQTHQDASYVDRSEGYDDDHSFTWRQGMRVRHPKFGIGWVQEVNNETPVKVTVRFEAMQPKKIIASYLEPC